jgi:hypothetical protein
MLLNLNTCVGVIVLNLLFLYQFPTLVHLIFFHLVMCSLLFYHFVSFVLTRKCTVQKFLASHINKESMNIIISPQSQWYWFRVIYSNQIPCPVQPSEQNHSLLIIASDGASFHLLKMTSIVLHTFCL